jgi:hypothetical protein
MQLFQIFKCFEQYSKKSNDSVFMCSLNQTSDTKKRLRYVNPNLIIQLELNPQINEKSQKYKAMTKKKRAASQTQLTKEKRDIASTHLGQIMLCFQDKDCIVAIYNFK